MHLDRTELQLLLLAARNAAWSARAEQERAGLPRLASAEAYERLAARLETELVRAPAIIVGACGGAHAPPGESR